MSDTRRKFIGKLLAAFSLPAWITKVWGKSSYQSSDVAFSKWKKANATPEITPSMHVLDQGCKNFRNDMTQNEWLEKSSGKSEYCDWSERITPRGWRMKQHPSDTMMNSKMGWRGDSKGFV